MSDCRSAFSLSRARPRRVGREGAAVPVADRPYRGMMTVMDTLERKGAVITGGASGIGFATARELGRRNARVVIADIEAAALASAVGQLKDEGVESFGVECDVTSFDAMQSLAAESFERLGAVHVV